MYCAEIIFTRVQAQIFGSIKARNDPLWQMKLSSVNEIKFHSHNTSLKLIVTVLGGTDINVFVRLAEAEREKTLCGNSSQPALLVTIIINQQTCGA